MCVCGESCGNATVLFHILKLCGFFLSFFQSVCVCVCAPTQTSRSFIKEIQRRKIRNGKNTESTSNLFPWKNKTKQPKNKNKSPSNLKTSTIKRVFFLVIYYLLYFLVLFRGSPPPVLQGAMRTGRDEAVAENGGDGVFPPAFPVSATTFFSLHFFCATCKSEFCSVSSSASEYLFF